MALLNDEESHQKFFDTLLHFRVSHYFVCSADDVILFAKSKRKYTRLITFLKGNIVEDLSL